MNRFSIAAVLCIALTGCTVKSDSKPKVNCPDGRCRPAVNRTGVNFSEPIPYQTVTFAELSEVPVMNLPLSARQKNWISRGGSGSCVVASSVMLLRWQGLDDMATLFRNSYSGGQSSSSINAKFQANNLRFAYTTSGDVKFLEWCCRTRRGAGIGYYPSHCINLADLSDTTAYLMDCNRIGHYIEVPREQFVREWRTRYGGWAFGLVYSPAAPLAHQ